MKYRVIHQIRPTLQVFACVFIGAVNSLSKIGFRNLLIIRYSSITVL